MLYFLEGPDGGGKTTLAYKLSEMFRTKMVHFGAPKSDEEKLAMFSTYTELIRHNNNLVVDRCWYSDMCYGPVMRGEATITPIQMYQLERAAALKGAMIIYCTGTKTELWRRATRRGEDYVTTRENFDSICDAYETMFNVLPHLIPVVRYKIEAMF